MKRLEMPNFKHGINIHLAPKKLDLENFNDLKSQEIKKEFLKDTFNPAHLVDQIVASNGKITCIETNANESTSKNIVIDSSKEPISLLLINLKENSTLKIYIIRKGETKFCAQEIRILLGENSNAKIYEVQDLGKETNYFSKKVSIGKKDSELVINDLVFGSSYSSTKGFFNLLEEGSRVNASSYFMSKEKSKYDLNYQANHKEKNTKSKLISKGTLFEESQVLSRGLIKISKQAKDSEAYEKQELILLSKDAKANAIPKLEIKNSEVKCSHGSSIGNIDEEKLYYMMSRGINKNEAVRLYIEGIYNEYINKIKDEETKEKVSRIVEEKLNEIKQ